MTVTLFCSILSLGSLLSGLLTQAIKQAYRNDNKPYSPNMIALVDSIVIGGGGTASVYILLDKEWNINNIICLLMMCLAVWIGCMIGFDKVVQTMTQIDKKTELIAQQNENNSGNTIKIPEPTKNNITSKDEVNQKNIVSDNTTISNDDGSIDDNK